MYNGFFGLKEKPFRLIPNPDYLFLGKSHEEALAHLNYAASQGEGFVEVTGEVGTGKTTLCRFFLENLGQHVEVAYIFNSRLSAIQLLREIHSELKIPIPEGDSVDLIHSLNRFLLEKKSHGKCVILLIDEAQHLGKKTLEQLRMLSNLETTRSKLIQIILVGQPELRELLDTKEMRQLRQRISLSCHIHPLSKEETAAYISYRIQVASKGRVSHLFSAGALELAYTYSSGIPRMVNILCDRALLTAYSLNKAGVDEKTMHTALKELAAPTDHAPAPHAKKGFQWGLFLSLSTLAFACGLFFSTIEPFFTRQGPEMVQSLNNETSPKGEFVMDEGTLMFKIPPRVSETLQHAFPETAETPNPDSNDDAQGAL